MWRIKIYIIFQQNVAVEKIFFDSCDAMMTASSVSDSAFYKITMAAVVITGGTFLLFSEPLFLASSRTIGSLLTLGVALGLSFIIRYQVAL